MTLLLGTVSAQGGRGTLAYFTSTVASPALAFEGGTVDLAGLGTGSTASTLPTSVFQWTFSGASSTGTTSNCANVLTGTDITTEAMVPGHYCIAPITIHNDATNSVDAWLRMRLVRSTATDSGGANDALNDRLRIYLSEYSASTDNAQTAAQKQTADCTISSFKPDATTSAATIANVTATTGASGGGRTALTSIGASGRNLGKHPGLSSSSSAVVTAVNNLYTKGLDLATGTGAFPTEGNMVTTPGSTATAYNLTGNNEVTNPVVLTAINSLTVGNSHGTVNASESGSATSTAGSSASVSFHPTDTESQILKGGVRYFCAAVFFPTDTDITFPTVMTAQNGSVTQYTAAYSTATSGSTSPIVGANKVGDNSAHLGSNTYYFVVTAAQKAGRTDN